MVKYRLSQNISIIDPADFPNVSAPAEHLHGNYILADQQKGREFLINETVKYFIDKFSHPKTQAEVLKEVAFDVQTEVKDIEKKCASFFKYLCKRKIVVPEDWVETKVGRQTLFKEGDFIGDLQVLNVIASKKYVDIYLTLNNLTGVTYVVKLLNSNKISGKEKYSEELQDLKHEYEMLQTFKDVPSVCQVYSFKENGEQSAYLVLEHIKGKPLPQFLKQTESLIESDCYTLILNILQAFTLLHESNLIHGDIHPSNIMVNDDRSIKIIDLGFSFNVEAEKDELIKFGGVLYYMPPERINISSQNKFSKEPDFLSDVYQLGLIIYFIFYRKEPFSGFIWEELSANIKRQEITYPAMSFSNFPVPEPVIQIIAKCAHKKPRKRYKTANSLFKDFENWFLRNNF